MIPLSRNTEKGAPTSPPLPTTGLGVTAAVARALRLHQWSKNLLVFVPLMLSHRFAEPKRLWLTLAAFLAFSFTASAMYLSNDLFDIEADRKHSRKRDRPIASGMISRRLAVLLAILSLIGGLLLGWSVSVGVLLVLLGYCTLAMLYSAWLKLLLLVDVFVLGALYGLRIVAGGVAADVYLSPWLIQFSLFAFLSLALAKRYAELRMLRLSGASAVERRGYTVADMELLTILGVASGVLSALVVAMYINGPEVAGLYRRPQALWAICPLVLYWFARVWLLAHRGLLSDDPVLFAVRDRPTYVAGAACLVVFAFAL